jgi:dTDP-glucose 4,6-dehydratase
MRRELSKILVTGGAGFIGGAFVRLIAGRGYRPAVVDRLTYAADLSRLKPVKGKYRFYRADICDSRSIAGIFKRVRPSQVVHLAAQTHVDRSIRNAAEFIHTNVQGTQVILDAALKYGLERLVYVSTDEVYGEAKRGKFREDSPLRPNSPYAASKAAADLLVQAYIRTYGLPAIIVRPSNNYGPWQYPEKLIPLAILKIFRRENIPVYAKGKNVREWLFVEDCARGILAVLEKARPGQVYNLGSGEERQNIEVVKMVLKKMGIPAGGLEFVKDRPGHDIRYRLDSGKLKKDINWASRVKLEKGLEDTLRWYCAHKDWVLSKWKNIAALYKTKKERDR